MVGLILALMVLPLTVLSVAVPEEDDPCKNYKMLEDDGGRSMKCSLYHPDSHDRFITEGWRRVQIKTTREDLTMPMACVEHGYCGSHSSVWLNGTHPTVEDGIVDRMGCLSMFSSCCHVQYPIQIKNCTDYMVYNLKRTLGSDERYCFGDSAHCNLTSHTTTESSTTETTRPIVETKRPTTETKRPTTATTRPTTKTTRPTTVSSTTKTTRRTTVSSTTKTTRPTTVFSTTKTTRPTTVLPDVIVDGEVNPKRSESVDINQLRNQQGTNERLDSVEAYTEEEAETADEMVTILAVFLCITIVIVVILVIGIFFYMRQRKSGKQYEIETKPTKMPY